MLVILTFFLFSTNFKICIYSKACELRKLFGRFSYPVFEYSSRAIGEAIEEIIKNYYLHVSNSRPSPSVRDTIMVRNKATGERGPVAKQYMLHNLDELYDLFKKDHPDVKIGRTKFSILKPDQCKWPGGHGRHNVCVCEIHENFKLLMDAIGQEIETSELATKVLCEDKSSECYLGFCDHCPNFDEVDEMLQILDESETVEFYNWEGTDRTSLIQMTESVSDFKDRIKNYIPKLMSHHHIYHSQQAFIDHVKNEVLPLGTAVLVQVDYGQNYAFIVQNAVQVMSRIRCLLQ